MGRQDAYVGSAKLDGVWLMSTGEPCPMCVAIALLAGVGHIGFGASHKTIAEAGYETLGLPVNAFVEATSKKPTVVGGICEDSCNELSLQNRKAS